MESVGTILGDGGEWISSSSSSFNGMFSSTEEADFMAQLLGNCSFPNEISSISNLCWPSPVYSSSSSSSSDHNTMFSFSSHDSQGSSSHHNGGASFFPTISSDSSHHHLQQYYYDYPILTRNDSSVSSLNCYMMAADHVNKNSSTNSMELLMEAETGDEYLNPDLSNDDSMEESARDLLLIPNPHEDEEKFPIPETSLEDQEDSLSGTSKKRPRMPMDNQVKNKRIVKPKKNQKLTNINNGGENDNKYPAVLQRQQSNINCLSEEDDSNVSQEQKTSSISATNVNGKTRASRGSATDPQSLYARKRRERINERLRILQNLVPNGTKVDISTMLEEAVQYVKFLQLQIKLLSSDDLWMYAPIAYNGMNIGLDLKIATTPKSS